VCDFCTVAFFIRYFYDEMRYEVNNVPAMSTSEKLTSTKNKDDMKITKDNFAIIRVSSELKFIFA
jgi:hypothetical protein